MYMSLYIRFQVNSSIKLCSPFMFVDPYKRKLTWKHNLEIL